MLLSDTALADVGDFIFASNVEDGAEGAVDYLLVLGALHIQLIERAARSFHNGDVQKIIGCGRYSKKTGRVMYEKLPAEYQKLYQNEATMIREILLSMNVPDNVILCETESTNIRENIEYGIQIAYADALASKYTDVSGVLRHLLPIVCSRRVLMTFDAIAPAHTDRYLFVRIPREYHMRHGRKTSMPVNECSKK